MDGRVEDEDWTPSSATEEADGSRRFGGYDEDVVSGAADAMDDDDSLEDKRLRRALARKQASAQASNPTTLESMKDGIVAKDREMRIAEKKAGDNIRATVSEKEVKKHFQPQTQRLLNRINLGNTIFSATGVDLSQAASSSIKEHTRKEGGAAKANTKDRADRATVEQVLDPRTRMILFKLINNGYFNEINGCISTGKEANVYHAVRTVALSDKRKHNGEVVGIEETAEGENVEIRADNGLSGPMEMAVKIFKTSILVFKDRDQYVTGEFRFRRGYSRHNPRKMVRVWAEKEMRNLVRMHAANIPCPQPLLLRNHVLIMGYIGKQGWAAPRLKDAGLNVEQFRDAYGQVVKHMRTLYNKCRLVHADLSEYNILYYKKTCYIIDVGQAVENDHPSALEFLRRDAANINLYFHKNDVLTMSNRELFDFIIDPTLLDEQIDEYLERVQDRVATRARDQTDKEAEIEDKVFLQAFIPRTMDEVAGEDIMLDRYKVLTTGDTESVYYRRVLGLNNLLTGADKKPDLLKKREDFEELDDEEREQQALQAKAAIESFYATMREGGFDEEEEWEEDDEEWDEDEEYDDYDEDEEFDEGDEEDEEDEEDGEEDEAEVKDTKKKSADKNESDADDDEMPALIPLKKPASKTAVPSKKPSARKYESEEEEEDEEDEEEDDDYDAPPARATAKMVSFRLPGGHASQPKAQSKKFADEEEEDEEDEEYDEEDDEYDDDLSGDDEEDEEDEEDAEDDEDGEDGEGAGDREKKRAHRNPLSKEDRKAHKAAVKKEKAEKRKVKIPKFVKKRAKATKGRKK